MPAAAGSGIVKSADLQGLSAGTLPLVDPSPQDADGMTPTGWGTGDLMTPLAVSETERRFRFRGLPQAVGAARRVLREWERLFDPVLFYDLSLCVSELVTNLVQHGDRPEGEQIELAVRRSERLVRAELGESHSDVSLTTPTAMKSGDWGMFIVDRVADRWGVDRREGTRVWCEIDLASDGRSRGSLAA